LDLVEFVAKLGKENAYTVEEVAKITNMTTGVAKKMLEDAIAAKLVEVADFEFGRALTDKMMQVKTITYYRRIW
jgi:hypothetical protein